MPRLTIVVASPWKLLYNMYLADIIFNVKNKNTLNFTPLSHLLSIQIFTICFQKNYYFTKFDTLIADVFEIWIDRIEYTWSMYLINHWWILLKQRRKEKASHVHRYILPLYFSPLQQSNCKSETISACSFFLEYSLKDDAFCGGLIFLFSSSLTVSKP